MIPDPDHRIHVGFGPGSWNAQLRHRLAAVRPNALPVLARFLTAAQQGASPRAGPAVSPQEESAGPFTELAPEPLFRDDHTCAAARVPCPFHDVGSWPANTAGDASRSWNWPRAHPRNVGH